MDNLSTHVILSLYKAFEPQKVRELAKKLEIHYTSKHGSWLYIAEIAISILSKRCINKRIPSIENLNKEIAGLKEYQNSNLKQINLQFTTEEALIKLKTLYSVI